MTVKLSDLSQADQDALVSQLAAKLQGGSGGQFNDLATKLITDTRKQAELEFKAVMEKTKREGELAELSLRLVEGSPDAPRGLKNVAIVDLQKHLAALPADESKYFSDLLTSIVKDGLVEFTELGHSRKITTLKPVPDFAQTSLKRVVAAGNSVEQFFELAGLGDPTHYDLTPFVQKAGGNGKDK